MIPYLVEGGPFVWLLIFCSLISVTVILERAWTLRRGSVLPGDVLLAIEKSGDAAQHGWLRNACEARPSPLGRLVLTALDHLAWSRDDNAAALEMQARQEVVRMERGLVLLEIITGIAPLLGLVGTLYGIIPLFGDFGKALAGDHALLAKGIGAALHKTLLGLLVAIPSLVAWSYFNKRVENLAVSLEGYCGLFLRRNYPPPGESMARESAASTHA